MGGDPVLIVDDNPVNLKLVRTVLAADGYDIRTAADGQEAWTVLEKFRPRLILMDIQLPGADGFELTRRLKSHPATRDIIVLAITAYAMPGDQEKAERAGCSGYITKPVDTRTLPATLKLYLGAPQVVRPAFEAGDYHDLLTELRANFLVDGEEEANALLHALALGLDLDRTQRIAHRWAGIAGVLGFAEIARQARGIEDFRVEPGKPGPRGMIAAGECVSRVRSELLSIRQLFSQAVRGKRETPVLPLAIWQVLAEKRFAVIGFERAEAARITGALEHARARCSVFRDLPDNNSLQPFHAGVVNVCQGEGIFSWVHSGVSADTVKPILFVGSAETLLRREWGIPERCWDFLLGPWDGDELIFRAFRLFSSHSNSKSADADHGPRNLASLMRTSQLTLRPDGF
jgi:two-component system cell cycle response regulator DivK